MTEEVSEKVQSSFAELAKLERDFEKAEVKVLKYSTDLLKPLYDRRRQIVADISNFWAIVIEQAGEDLDQYITPQDAELLESIRDINVTRDDTDPRSFTITLTFAENSFTSTTTMTKTFTYVEKKELDEEDSEDITGNDKSKYRSTKVPIEWKAGKDITATTEGSPYSFFTFFDWENSEDPKQKDVFERAAEVALFIAEELYPNAVKLYSEAVEEEEESDDEEIDLEEEDEEDEEDEEPQRKKARK